jgi:metal-responsive CopG/Arc/MetJ family transcriptional regulator
MANRVNITLSDENLEKVDKACKDLGIARSTYIAMAINEKIKNDEALRLMPDVIKAMQALKETNDQINLEQYKKALQMAEDKK